MAVHEKRRGARQQGSKFTVLGPSLCQHSMALYERAPRLHEVVHNHDMAALWVPLLDLDDALVTVADLCANDLRWCRC